MSTKTSKLKDAREALAEAYYEQNEIGKKYVGNHL